MASGDVTSTMPLILNLRELPEGVNEDVGGRAGDCGSGVDMTVIGAAGGDAALRQTTMRLKT